MEPIIIQGDSSIVLNREILRYNNFKPFDIVYLDPPYSTGYAFSHYDDDMSNKQWRVWFRGILQKVKDIIHDESLIIIHLDDNQSHYAKVFADEIFGEQSFRNEIVLKRTQKNTNESQVNVLKRSHDICLIYKSKGKLNNITILNKRKPYWHSFGAPGIRQTLEYELFGYRPKKGNHWRWSEIRAKESIKRGILRPNPKTGRPEYLVSPGKQSLGTLWTDKISYNNQKSFQTAKSTAIIKRLLSLYPANKKDVAVIDPFLGSGTTLEACIELGFSFVGIDLNIAESIKKRFDVKIITDKESNKACTDFGHVIRTAAKW